MQIRNLTLRAKFSLAYSLVSLTVGVLSYLIREHLIFTLYDGYLRNMELHWVALSALFNVIVLGSAAYVSWPLFGDNRDNLFFKSLFGNATFGFLLPFVTLLVVAISMALLVQASRILGVSLGEYSAVRIPAIIFFPIWGSIFYVMLAGGIVGMIFGKLKGQ